MTEWHLGSAFQRVIMALAVGFIAAGALVWTSVAIGVRESVYVTMFDFGASFFIAGWMHVWFVNGGRRRQHAQQIDEMLTRRGEPPEPVDG